MKRIMQWVMAATLTISGMGTFTACTSNDDNTVDAETGASSIAMIGKLGHVEYWQQMESAFRGICQEKDLGAIYYTTTEENAYQEQIAAVENLTKRGDKKLKGIVFAPSYGVNGESAEAQVAAFAQQRGIPVILLDSPVGSDSPLASCPYFGTDNAAAGRAMAAEVTADKVAAFAMQNSPGIERAEAFKALKPGTVVYTVDDHANADVQAVIDQYDDFVFFNGSTCADALAMLTRAGKRIYTFDMYAQFFDVLQKGSTLFKGVMVQNTFGMTRKAVEAVLAGAKQGEMVPAFFVTKDNLDDADVKPFVEFYQKDTPAIEGHRWHEDDSVYTSPFEMNRVEP